jgi:drug/metabolite transporter (DMT)-like permease
VAAVLPHSDTAARLRGVGLICVALIIFALLDALAKYASHSVPVIEIVWVRFLGQTMLLLVVFRPWRDLALYRTRRPVAQLLRSCALFGSTIFNFIALRHLQLDQTASIGFATAFVTAGLAGPMLGEWVGPRRWAAIVVGFIGVLIVIGPAGHSFDPAMLFSVCAMLCYSLYNLLTRMLAATEPPSALLLFSGLVPTIALAPFALPVAILPPSGWVGAAVLGTALCGAVGHWILIHAFRLAPASLLAPFTYTQIIWMPALGFLFFGDRPGFNTIIGAAIIVASGLYILYRERVHGDR